MQFSISLLSQTQAAQLQWVYIPLQPGAAENCLQAEVDLTSHGTLITDGLSVEQRCLSCRLQDPSPDRYTTCTEPSPGRGGVGRQAGRMQHGSRAAAALRDAERAQTVLCHETKAELSAKSVRSREGLV